jgi:xanthine/CO dehydrogenase XdhC/CoxF family maturation factor
MIVFPDGTIEGTVGGGLVEKKVIEKALAQFALNQPIIFPFELVPSRE